MQGWPGLWPCLRTSAARCLWPLSRLPRNKALIYQAGAVPALLRLLSPCRRAIDSLGSGGGGNDGGGADSSGGGAGGGEDGVVGGDEASGDSGDSSTAVVRAAADAAGCDAAMATLWNLSLRTGGRAQNPHCEAIRQQMIDHGIVPALRHLAATSQTSAAQSDDGAIAGVEGSGGSVSDGNSEVLAAIISPQTRDLAKRLLHQLQQQLQGRGQQARLVM